jgi:hypothetical protein
MVRINTKISSMVSYALSQLMKNSYLLLMTKSFSKESQRPRPQLGHEFEYITQAAFASRRTGNISDAEFFADRNITWWTLSVEVGITNGPVKPDAVLLEGLTF